MEYTIIKLTEMTPLHVGTGRESLDFSSSDLQSDTLTAALAAIRAQQGKTENVKEFLNSFALSSAFPFWKDSLFLPKPQGKINVIIDGQEEHEYRKKLKKVQFVELPLWNKLIKGEQCKVSCEQVNGSFLAAKKDIPVFFKSEVKERVSVSRNGKDAVPFFFDWKYFDKEAGLFCITDAKGDMLEEIIALFEQLGEYGIGTDRNCGGGKFSVDASLNISIDPVQNADSQMLLSMYLPEDEEANRLNLQESKYELRLRGGYIAGSNNEQLRHLRKKSVYMFNAGSVFKTSAALKGKVVDLRPSWNDASLHPVYRSGKPLSVAIKMNEL